MSKEKDNIIQALDNIAITFDELGFEPTTVNDKNYEHFNEWFSFEIYKIELNTNEQENQIKQLKQQLTKKSQQIKKSKQTIKEKNSFGLALFATLYELLEEIDPENVSSRISFCTRQKKSLYDDTYKTIRNLQHRLEEKDKEIESLKKADNIWLDSYQNELDTLRQNQTQLAIQELEKVKDWLNEPFDEDGCFKIGGDLIDFIDQQIKELRGGK